MNEMNIVVGSTNPTKIRSAELAFSQVFSGHKIHCIGEAVGSGVPDQPFGDSETLLGAKNRMYKLNELFPEFHYFVGIEGGLKYFNSRMFAFAWISILHKGRVCVASSAAFLIPKEVQVLVEQGEELGVANDLLFHKRSSKSGSGAIGILTNDLITRTELYRPAVIMALIDFFPR